MSRISVRPFSSQHANRLASSGIHPVLARVFAARGISSADELSTAASNLIEPSRLMNIDRAAGFLADAILEKKKITVVADYDCDGATACATAIRGLKLMGGQADYIVPNRFDNGFGLSPAIARQAREEHDTQVLVTVDNGIASNEGIKTAVELGMKVLITDHHLPGSTLPEDCIIVNPNQEGCPFESKHLAGVGVIFYVLLALRAELRRRHVFDETTQPRLNSLLDLVALGTVADVVRLDKNNRILVYQGLRRIRSNLMQPGVAALFKVSGRNPQSANPADLGFAIGPRLNAVGRLEDMSIGVECLLTDDATQAQAIAERLDEINVRRREIEENMRQEAQEIIAHFRPENQATICVCSDDWHQGIVGILASRIREKYFRPAIAFAVDANGLLRGSGRSIASFHLKDALDLVSKRHPGLILQFGGHAMAAGLTLHADGFDEFAQAFEDVASNWLSRSKLERIIETDGSLADDCLTVEFAQLIHSYIWGHAFPAPVFLDDFRVVSQRVLKNAHLRLRLEKNGQVCEAIWFGHSDMLPEYVRVAYRLDINEYAGRTNLQLFVVHIESQD